MISKILSVRRIFDCMAINKVVWATKFLSIKRGHFLLPTNSLCTTWRLTHYILTVKFTSACTKCTILRYITSDFATKMIEVTLTVYTIDGRDQSLNFFARFLCRKLVECTGAPSVKVLCFRIFKFSKRWNKSASNFKGHILCLWEVMKIVQAHQSQG